MKTEKLKVLLIDKETGKQTELPNAIGTIQVSDPEPQPQADGRYAFNVSCKAHISRRNLKHLKRLLTPPRPPKYISKAKCAKAYLQVKKDKTFDELVSMTRRQLGRLAAFALMESVLKVVSEPSHRVVPDFPSGGIVGCYPTINRGELVIQKEKAAEIARNFLQPPTDEDYEETLNQTF